MIEMTDELLIRVENNSGSCGCSRIVELNNNSRNSRQQWTISEAIGDNDSRVVVDYSNNSNRDWQEQYCSNIIKTMPCCPFLLYAGMLPVGEQSGINSQIETLDMILYNQTELEK